jgi:hypothetical protein
MDGGLLSMLMEYGKNIDVTSYAKLIFGKDLVESAYISDKYNKHSDSDYKDVVNFNNDEISLTDCVILIVKLTNGRVINIWASELCGIRAGEPDTLY